MEMDYEKRISKREEMGEVSDNAAQEESRKLMTKLVDSKEQKATNCSQIAKDLVVVALITNACCVKKDVLAWIVL